MPSSLPIDRDSVVAVVVAGGRGVRAGRDGPKQYAALGGKAVLRRTMEALLACPGVDAGLVVIGAGDRPPYDAAVAGLPRLLPPVEGGETRQQSVRNGLEALAATPPRLVLVHDAARPFVSAAVVERVIAACTAVAGALPVMPLHETIKRLDEGRVVETVPREALAGAQTPQGFPFAPLLDAHRRAAAAGRHDLTDDAAVAALAGIAVTAVPGERANVKLTEPEDFAAAERLLAPPSETRSAQGFDVHAFGPGASVWLCGVEIPYDHGLRGHSDADVGLHALVDALLGTIGDGDIGQHFPPTDPQWRGASSDRFLADAVRRVAARGGRIVNLDVTLVCEAPKIGPHRAAMQARIAAIAGIAPDRVGIKATTNEGMGFIGRKEGIAALALATVALPAGA
jgi:2-C-methyl-D-erythritol 4-phosphate cytidylyltransferase/2-C-methyl-D-erythritol 2,4-cyclodiphosphate synthase